MGTRSLLGYEGTDKKVYYQYLQFDGYPTVQGKNFFHFVQKTFREAPSHFTNGARPNSVFFEMIVDYFNYKKWSTAHSFINNRSVANVKDFIQVNSWQAWQYWFDASGAFHVLRHVDKKSCFKIPFKALMALSEREFDEDSLIWLPVWTSLEEDMKVTMSITHGESHSFPQQGEFGWRKFTSVLVNAWKKDENEKLHNHTVTVNSMFSKEKVKRKVKKIVLKSNLPQSPE